ncbi:MAG TPA: AbiV family abortive infection protein [Streptosporangiaceae bacterium]|nr:AbiV family abortive infection protein [Streptosporangiaceae bacterium]
MDLAAVREAPASELARGSVAAARNAWGLAEDAELLAGAERLARAYSLAGLAVEEVGKAAGLATLAAMPENVRAQAPLGRMLEWHQMKLVAGHMVAAVPFSSPTLAVTYATMPLTEVAWILDEAQASARDIDRLKQRGLYVDVDHTGRVREPSEVTAAEVRVQLDRARQATSATEVLLDPRAPAKLAHPGVAAVEFSRALVSAFTETRPARTASAAADVLLNAVNKLQS